MSYLTFHLLFTLPPTLVMGATLPQSLREMGGWRAQWAIPLIALIACTYTTPWDNYLVAREVWWYGSDRVIATIGFVPVEEYFFFLIQPVLTGLFLFQYLGRTKRPLSTADKRHGWLGFGVFGVLTGLGIMLLGRSDPSGLYMGLVLTWAAPLLAGMWLYDGEALWTHRRSLLYGIGVPTLYLWLADGVAIANSIWTISDQFTLKYSIFGLPIEEATFFLFTNMLVIKGILLLLYGRHSTLATRESAN